MSNFAWLKERLKNYSNVQYIDLGCAKEEFEIPAIVELKKFCDSIDDETYTLFFHHKGVTNLHKQPIADWRNIMSYFTIERWRDCVEKLDEGHELVGSLWRTFPRPHFSGTFFWARSSYIKRLPALQRPRDINYNRQIPGLNWDYRFEGEMWMAMADPKYYSLYDTPTDVDHYNVEWPKNLYRTV
jgi:hypothetical protein